MTLSCKEEAGLDDRPHPPPTFSSELLEVAEVATAVAGTFPSLEDSGFEVLQRLEPLERKLPKVMEPWVLMKGVARWDWLG